MKPAIRRAVSALAAAFFALSALVFATGATAARDGQLDLLYVVGSSSTELGEPAQQEEQWVTGTQLVGYVLKGSPGDHLFLAAGKANDDGTTGIAWLPDLDPTDGKGSASGIVPLRCPESRLRVDISPYGSSSTSSVSTAVFTIDAGEGNLFGAVGFRVNFLACGDDPVWSVYRVRWLDNEFVIMICNQPSDYVPPEPVSRNTDEDAGAAEDKTIPRGTAFGIFGGAVAVSAAAGATALIVSRRRGARR